jgi:carbon storage regulator
MEVIMLVLYRQLGEKIVIGDDITIMVVGFKGDGVKLGIDAPHEVIVDREEVAERRAQTAEDRKD